MKTYKKSILFLAIIINNSNVFAETKTDVSNKIMTAHANFFNPTPNTNLDVARQSWNQALDELKNYVDDNAVANKVLKDTAKLVTKVGRELATSMKVNELLSSENELNEMKNKLEKESFWWQREQKEDAKQLLLIVIDLLQNTINNLRKKQGLPPEVIIPVETEKLIPTNKMSSLGLCKVQPCEVSLGSKNGLNRQLLQLSMAEQIEARCGGLSLINILWTDKYEKSGDVSNLTYLKNASNVQKILNEIGCGNWVNIKAVKDYIKSAGVKGYDISNIDAISSVLVLNNDLAEFLFKEEVNTGNELKSKVRKGLTQNYFFQGIIIGDEEARVTGVGHYFAFVIIKKGNQVQYIIIDSLTDANHLEVDSYRRRRIDYLIDQLETGKAASLIPFTRFRPMVDDIKIFIEKTLNKAAAEKELVDQGILKQEEFLKDNKGDLENILDQIKQYRLLLEDPRALQNEEIRAKRMMGS